MSHLRVVEVDLDDRIGGRLFRRERLDAIGPARYAELPDLSDARFREVKP